MNLISNSDPSEVDIVPASTVGCIPSELFPRNEEERFVIVLKRKEKKSGGGGNNEYRCRFCGLKITGGPAKIRAHFVDGVDAGQRVKKCTAPSDPGLAGNNSEAVAFVCGKRKSIEEYGGKRYRKKGNVHDCFCMS